MTLLIAHSVMILINLTAACFYAKKNDTAKTVLFCMLAIINAI